MGPRHRSHMVALGGSLGAPRRWRTPKMGMCRRRMSGCMVVEDEQRSSARCVGCWTPSIDLRAPDAWQTSTGRRSAKALGPRIRATVADNGLRPPGVGTPRGHIRGKSPVQNRAATAHSQRKAPDGRLGWLLCSELLGRVTRSDEAEVVYKKTVTRPKHNLG